MNSDRRNPDPPERLDLQTLSAFIDGELPPAVQAAVRAGLERDPDAKMRVNAWRAQNAALKVLCGDLDKNASLVVLRKRTSRLKHVAMAAGWLAAGITLGATMGSLLPRVFEDAHESATFAHRADIAYAVYAPEVRHPVEVGAHDETQLISWLSKRLGRPVSIPSLQEYGYTLVGGRLLPGEKGPAAQFMYESRQGARLTLYVVRTSTGEMAFQHLRDDERITFYWASDHLGYALSGPKSEAKLREIAADVCSSLGGRPQSWSD
ncbi:MAG TPA: anti-sigma factor [Trinickia sp.]|uniref:anti-sigma factor family protein n=1 Tax=Trinickia sp. TaxID=2571163 RepID=UPI002D19F712|nr:anti-sigma factor [Trinickia sp.]HTI19002.1 anti-sigma factor [Trinickia sp.]